MNQNKNAPLNFNAQTFAHDAEVFYASLLKKLSVLGFSTDRKSMWCDHLCFRVATIEEYEFYKSHLQNFGTLLTEAPVNGRPICTFKMQNFSSISLIELPAPKSGTHYTTGFEHGEFVVAESFESIKKKFPSLKFTLGGNPMINPELCFRFDDSTQVKFHYLPLDRVIEIEKAKITDIVFDFDGTLMDPNQAYNLYAGVKDLLIELHKKNIHLHIWTGRDFSSLQSILKDQGIKHLFQTISCPNDKNRKPQKENLQVSFNTENYKTILMVGDSPVDMAAGKSIGAICVSALWDVSTNALFDVQNSHIQAGSELQFMSIKVFSQFVFNTLQ